MNILKRISAIAVLITIWMPPVLFSQQAERELIVFSLKNAVAHDVAAVVRELIGETSASGSKLAVDTRTNSLLIAGSNQDVKVIQEIVENLDVPPQRKTNRKNTDGFFKAYPFENVHSLESSMTLLQSMLQDRKGVRMDLDRRNLSLYLQGADADHQFAKTIIDQVQRSGSVETVGNVHVATVLVIDGEQVNEHLRPELNLKEPGERLKEVFATAKKKGLLNISTPMIASRVTSLIRPSSTKQTANDNSASGQFGNESRGSGFALSNNGTLVQLTNKNFKLNSAVNISVGTGGQIATEFASVIELPLDHPVLLSCSTIGSFDSVIVVTLTSE